MKVVFLKWVYTVFIGLLLATFVGVGIQAFYPPPKQPQALPHPTMPVSTPSAVLKQSQDNTQKWQDYQTQFENYNKDVSVIATAASILFLVLSITVLQKIALISDGILLGGVLTELYSIFRGFTSGDDKVRFLVVTVGLIIALFLGYIKFSKVGKKK